MAGKTPVLPSLGISGLGWVDGGGGGTSSDIVAEGIPPVPVKLLEKIRKWEFVDLSLLLVESGTKSEEVPLHHDNRVLLFQSVDQAQKRRKQIVDIHSWTQAFATYMAALASHSSTTMEEVLGLISHLHLITQVARDLGGNRWVRYDQDFRMWAAAKGVRRWGELNLIIYGRCLAMPVQTLAPPPPPGSNPFSPDQRSRWAGEKKGKGSRSTTRKGGCFRWNFEGGCDRIDCHFLHSCYHCGDAHRATDCPRPPKRSRRDGDS